MEYIVKIGFDDLQDNNFRYNPGDVYPRKGVKPSKERINELSSENNKRGIVLINAVKASEAKETKEAEEKNEGKKEEDKSKKPVKSNKKPS